MKLDDPRVLFTSMLRAFKASDETLTHLYAQELHSRYGIRVELPTDRREQPAPASMEARS